jgi:hypothetical protein
MFPRSGPACPQDSRNSPPPAAKRPKLAGKPIRMRKTLRTIVVVALLTLGYMAWPYYGLYQFILAVESGDAAKVSKDVDFRALRFSLASQIVDAYLRRSGTKLSPLAQAATATVAETLADPIVAKLVTPEALIDFLKNGWPNSAVSDAPAGPVDVAGISISAMGTAWQTFEHSEYGFGKFDVVLPVTAPPDQQFKLRFRLSQLRWKLRGIVLPPPVQNLLADELIKSLTPLATTAPAP